MEDSIVQKVKALDPLFQEVSALENTHVSFTLLQFCMGVCKVNYLLRVTPVQCTKSGAQVFDELVEKSLRHSVGGVLDTEIFRELQLSAEVKLNCQNPRPGACFYRHHHGRLCIHIFFGILQRLNWKCTR